MAKSVEDFREEETNRKLFEEEQKIVERMELEKQRLKNDIEIDEEASEWKRVSRDLEEKKLSFNDIVFWEKAVISSLPNLEVFREKSKNERYAEDVNFRIDLKERLENRKNELLEQEKAETEKRNKKLAEIRKMEIESQNEFYR